MFSEERARWTKFFDMFKKHFNEEVGFIPSVYESDDIDIDFIVGEEKSQLYGIQVLQMFPDGELDEEDEEGEREEDDDDNKDDDDEDDDEPVGYVIEYMFVKTDQKVEDITDEKRFELDFDLESEGDAEKVHLDFYANKDDEFTAITVKINNEFHGVFLEHPEFDF